MPCPTSERGTGESGRRESDPLILGGSLVCSHQHFARRSIKIGVDGRTRTGIGASATRRSAFELHPRRWTPRRDSHPCGTVARPLCRRPPSATRPLGVGCGGGSRTPDLPVNSLVAGPAQLLRKVRSAEAPGSGEPRPAGSGLVPPAGVGPAVSWVKARRVAVPPRRRGRCHPRFERAPCRLGGGCSVR